VLVYLGVGAVAAATLLYEVALTRIFSIAYGYHFAFLAMSLGLLGFGASGTLLELRPPPRQPLHPRLLARLAAAASLALVCGYAVSNLIPFDPYRVGWEPSQLALLAAYLLCYAVAFLLAGLVLGLPLMRWPARAPCLYGANLAGSAAGAGIALVALDRADPTVAVLLAGLTAALGSVGFTCARSEADAPADREWRADRFVGLTAAGLVLVVLWQTPSWLEIRLSPYKPLSQLESLPDAQVLERKSSAASRIDVVSSSTIHSAPGLTLQYQGSLPEQSAVVLDGEVVLPLTAREGLTHGFVDGLPISLAHHLRPASRTLVLEPGGGLEVLSALELGARSVVAVENNRLLAALLTSDLSSRAGGIYADPRVELVVSNPRGYLSHPREPFDLITLALSENRRAVTAGAFSLSETYPLTAEAFDAYLAHLAPEGLLIVHRWLQLPPTEELRAGALVVDALRRAGKSPDPRIIAIRSFSTMLILAKREPFTPAEIELAKEFARKRQFDLVWYPGIQPGEANVANVLRRDRYHETFQQLLSNEQAGYDRYEYDVAPPRDTRPFFFHFFTWEQTPTVIALLGKTWQPFGGSGYLILVALLVLTTGLSLALLLVPAAAIRRRDRDRLERNSRAPPMVYFAALGLGFLLVEVALVQRFVLFLDHSARSFAVVVFGLLAFSGLGSMWSARLPWRGGLAALVAVVALYPVVLSTVFPASLGDDLRVRIGITLLLLAPLGFLMGIGFPRGLASLGAARPSRLPLAWGVNGFTSVVSAILAPMIALSWGFEAVFGCAALAYAVALTAARSGPRNRAIDTVTAFESAEQTPRR
jgi:spermidine synthase